MIVQDIITYCIIDIFVFFALVEKNVKKKKYAEKLARVEKMLF